MRWCMGQQDKFIWNAVDSPLGGPATVKLCPFQEMARCVCPFAPQELNQCMKRRAFRRDYHQTC